MKKVKKVIAEAVALLMMVSMIAGCGSTDSPTGGTESAAVESETTKSEDSTTTVDPNESIDPLGKLPELVTLTRGAWIDTNITYPEGQSFGDDAYIRMLEEQFNIKLENAFEGGSGNLSEKVDLAIASGELPDFLVGLSYTQYKAALKAGLLMDISQVWDTYASDVTKEVYDNKKELFDGLVTQDGGMYAIPSSNPEADFLSVMWIRQDWLDNLDLSVPTNLEELEAVAIAFATQDPDGNGVDDTVGIVGPSTNGRLYQDMSGSNFSFHFDQIFATYNSFPGIWVDDGNGNAVYGSILPETRDALEKIASMYQNGAISQGMLTSETYELIASNKGGIFFGCWWEPFANIGNSWNNDNSVNWQPYSLASGDNGIYMAKGGNPAQVYTVISKDCKNPEAVIIMLNIFKDNLSNYVSEEDRNTLGDGLYPMYMTFGTDEGFFLLYEALDAYYNGKTVDEVHAMLIENNQDVYTFDNIISCKTEPYSDNSINGFDFTGDKAGQYGTAYSFAVGAGPFVESNYEFVYTLTYEKTKTMEQRWSNLSDLEYTTFSKIIMGEEPISAFDDFVTKWLKEGGETITAEIQDSLK